MVTFNYGGVMNVCPVCSSQNYPVEDLPHCVLGCISFQQEWFGIVGKSQDVGSHTCLFSALKAFKVPSDSETHSDFLLDPSPVSCSFSSCAICMKLLMNCW